MKKIPVRRIAATQKEIADTDRFTIRDVQELFNGNNLIQPLHRHDFFFILVLQKGQGIHEIDFVRYDMKDNSIFILRPGQVHQLELNAVSTGFLIAFAPTFYHPKDRTAHQRLKKATSKNFCEFDRGRFKKLRSILTYIFDEFTSKQKGYIEIIKANLDIFFIEFLRQSQGGDDGSNHVVSYEQERLEDFLELVSLHFTNRKQASQYADLLNLSTYQLNAITKSVLGKSASEVINEQIILEAKRYLLATPDQIKDIADHLGYEDTSYFIRYFKKRTGYSPDVYRRNFR